jgi:hypothetical protein
MEKADVVEHPEVFHHVGLLTNEPPGPNQTGWVALYLVVRRLKSISRIGNNQSLPGSTVRISAPIAIASEIHF